MRCSPTAGPARSWSRRATGAFGLFAGVLLLPRYFQGVRGVSATHSGLLIYPLLIGLIVGVNVAGGGDRPARRVPHADRASALGLLALGALGFATFDASTPEWESLLFMALIGLGVGPTLSGLQIAMSARSSRCVIGAGDGHAAAAAPGRRGGRARGRRRRSTAAAGVGRRERHRHRRVRDRAGRRRVAAAALLTLPRRATRIAPMLAPA